jgi:hypothetical protein
MKEATKIIILVAIFFVLGSGVFYMSFMQADFNFYKAEITANGNVITEKLYFSPNQAYHTLYRNFVSPATTISTNEKNYIQVNNVLCQEGQAYFRQNGFNCDIFLNSVKENQPCLAYTEDNEYGCTFGNTPGFKTNNEYWIESTYELKPENLFSINGKNYIKFIAYSKNKHQFLSPSDLKVSLGLLLPKRTSYSLCSLSRKLRRN